MTDKTSSDKKNNNFINKQKKVWSSGKETVSYQTQKR